MDSAFSRNLRLCTEKIASDLNMLIGSEITFSRREALAGREAAMAKFGTTRLVTAVTRRMDEASTIAGFVITERAAIELGSALIMLPRAESFTEEIQSAYSEIVNMIIGAWKTTADVPEQRLTNDVKVRREDRLTSDGFQDFLDENNLELVLVPFTFEKATWQFGIFGKKEWIFGDTPVEPVAPPAPAAAPPSASSTRQSGPPANSGRPGSSSSGATGRTSNGSSSSFEGGGARSGSGSHPSGPPVAREGRTTQATVMVVDVSGELRAWLSAKLASQELRACHPSADLHELDEQSAVVIIGPDPELFRQLTANRVVVTRAGDKRPTPAAS